MFKQSQGEFNILQNTWGGGGGIGPTGPTGPTGPVGPTGTPGTTASASTVTATVSLNTTQYLQVVVNGVPYRLGLVNL